MLVLVDQRHDAANLVDSRTGQRPHLARGCPSAVGVPDALPRPERERQ